MIRLARIGKKNHPTYRVVVSDKQKDTKAPYLEALGHYDPHQQPSFFDVNKERLQYWLEVGAQMSDTVHNLCVTHKLIDGDKRDVMHKQKKDESAESEAKPAADAQSPKPQQDNKPADDVKAEAPKEEKSEETKAEPKEDKTEKPEENKEKK